MTCSSCIAFITPSAGAGEWLLVFVVILLVFGPRRLPEIARTIGRTLEYLRRASQDFKDQVMRIEESPAAPPVSGDASETPPATEAEYDNFTIEPDGDAETDTPPDEEPPEEPASQAPEKRDDELAG